MTIPYWAVLLFAYLLGSVPFGLLIGLARGIDIRRQGSGNIGASNVMRLVGTPWAVVVLLLDAAKAALPIFLMRWAGYDTPLLLLLAGSMAVAGHSWPIFLKGKGGRGVASALGLLIALTPGIALIGFVVWVVVVAMFRYISLASMVAAVAIAGSMFVFQQPTVFCWGTSIIALFVVYRHLPNIRRLVAGTENRFGEKPRSM